MASEKSVAKIYQFTDAKTKMAMVLTYINGKLDHKLSGMGNDWDFHPGCCGELPHEYDYGRPAGFVLAVMTYLKEKCGRPSQFVKEFKRPCGNDILWGLSLKEYQSLWKTETLVKKLMEES